MLNELLDLDIVVIIRPHPQFLQVYPERIDSLKSEYSKFIENGKLVFDLDLLDNSSIFKSDILITDWSNIAFEFSFCTLKPSVFINTPIKILNPNYEEFELEALEISLRDKIGVSIDIEKINELKEVTMNMLEQKDSYKQKIDDIVKQYLYYPGKSGEAGGTYIIDQLATSIYCHPESSEGSLSS
jgi:YidC/Oxa1 family membrane protein insertase